MYHHFKRNLHPSRKDRLGLFRRWGLGQQGPAKGSQETLEGGQTTDVIIAVMGKTGVGKSVFINTLLGEPTMKVGHDIVSCTANLKWEVVNPALITNICPGWGDRRVIIVDTPGLDDTFEDDSEILRRIAAWLDNSYADDMKLGGIIYLHNVADPRMGGASRRGLQTFQNVSGIDSLSRIVLVTTRWDEVSREVGESREEALRSRFWKEMIDRQSTVARFDHTQRSALDILRHILA